jgi:hypothetical protein
MSFSTKNYRELKINVKSRKKDEFGDQVVDMYPKPSSRRVTRNLRFRWDEYPIIFPKDPDKVELIFNCIS